MHNSAVVSLVNIQRLLVVLSLTLLAACGGGSGSDSSTEQSLSQPQLFIAGAGIKGPLAFASVELYELDAGFEEFYESGNPLAAATTNAYAEITGLAVPADIAPPYILVIDGTNAIDRNTGVAPVISKLVTIITQEALDSRKPVYATPYTTLAYQMLKLSNFNELSLGNDLARFNQEIVQAIGFGIAAETDIFTTPPIITADSTTIEKQQLVINYRAAIEALSSMLYEISLPFGPSVTTDLLLELLALDLHSDSVIDDTVNSVTMGAIDTAALSRNPLRLDIPNTSYLVRDIVALMDEERSLIGGSFNIEFLKNDISVTLTPAHLSIFVDSSQRSDYNNPVGNLANALLLTGAVFSSDFNNYATDTLLSEQQIMDAFAPITSGIQNNAPTGVTVVADPANSGRGNALRVFFPEGEYRNSASGAAWQTRITPRDEYYFAYEIYVPVGFNWPLGLKIPGLFGGDLGAASGKKPVNGIDGFAVRQNIYSERQDGDTLGFSNIGNGAITATTYTVDASTKNRKYNPALTDSWDGAAKLTTGRWVRVEQRVALNDPSESNGIYEAWVDGVKVFSENDWTYRLSGSLQIDHISFIWYYGGTGDSWAAREDQFMYFDNFVVSTQPITH